MNSFLWNIFLAVVWAFAWGEFTLFNLLVGLGLGFAVLWLGGDMLGSDDYCRRAWRLVVLVLYFLMQVIQANLRVAYDVITPTHRMRAGIIALPLDVRTDGEITLLATMINLTPGTLVLGMTEDRKTLYVHAMYISDPDQEKRSLKSGFERRLLEVMR